MNETVKRILSAIVTLPIYIYAFYTDRFYHIPVLLVSLIISLACLYEYYKICDKGEGKRPYILMGFMTGVIINFIFYLYAFREVHDFGLLSELDLKAVFAAVFFLMIIIAAVQIVSRPIEGGIYSLAVTVFGVIFLAVNISHIMLLKALHNGFYYVLLVNIVIMVSDAGAYFGGLSFGRHKANFKVSPNKSWEGYAFGLVTGIISMLITCKIYENFFDTVLFNLPETIFLGAVLCFVGNIGDLVESAVKRDGATKDSGSIMPGHGGFWDVYDSLTLAVPLFYYYIIMKGVQLF